MFKRKKKKTGIQTPEFRKPSAPPSPPTSGSKVVKPNPNYVPPASVKENCLYETPCGWCTKWDKKCDNKIGPWVVPILKMPNPVAENIIEDVKNKIYESYGIPEKLIKEINDD